MRLKIILACTFLGGCSVAPVYEAPAVAAPDQPTAIKGAKKAANQAKLVGTVEISAVRKAYPLGPGPYVLCIKGTNSLPGARTYAVFFKNNDYVSVRSSVIIDDCEGQAFGSLGSGPFPEDAERPQPK
jgi:hypothetical protein